MHNEVVMHKETSKECTGINVYGEIKGGKLIVYINLFLCIYGIIYLSCCFYF